MKVIIIGSGFAGYTLARNLRNLSKIVKIDIFSESDATYYSKPMLSRALTANLNPESLIIKNALMMNKELDAKIYKNTKVYNIDTKKQIIQYYNEKQQQTLSTIKYDKLVLATGSKAKCLPEFNHPCVFQVNNLTQYNNFYQALQKNKKVTILGSGLVSCEFANDLSNKGYEVTIISQDSHLLCKFLPLAVSKYLRENLINNGVSIKLQQKIKLDASNKQMIKIYCNNKIIESTLLLAAIGIQANYELAQKSGIACNDGIICDQYLACNKSNVFALGDCAEVENHIYQYIPPIRQAASSLAKTLVGKLTAVNYPVMPIGVKTPSYPLSICVPKKFEQWQLVNENSATKSIKMLHCDAQNNINGVRLGGMDFYSERLQLVQNMQKLL